MLNGTKSCVEYLSLIAVGLVADGYILDSNIVVVVHANPGRRTIDYPQTNDVPIHQLDGDVFSEFVLTGCNIIVDAPRGAADNQQTKKNSKH